MHIAQISCRNFQRPSPSCGFCAGCAGSTVDLLHSSQWGKYSITLRKIRDENWFAVDLKIRTAGQFPSGKHPPCALEICKIPSKNCGFLVHNSLWEIRNKSVPCASTLREYGCHTEVFPTPYHPLCELLISSSSHSGCSYIRKIVFSTM